VSEAERSLFRKINSNALFHKSFIFFRKVCLLVISGEPSMDRFPSSKTQLFIAPSSVYREQSDGASSEILFGQPARRTRVQADG